jgi:threonine synthase
MLYRSTNNKSQKVNFRDAAIHGQAPDKGLYFPEKIPVIEKSFFDKINEYSKEEIAFKVIEPYVGNAIAKKDLQEIVSQTVNFDIPLVRVEKNMFSLELFHGPTLAFKDVGARFMSRCLGYFVKEKPADFQQKIH